MNPLDPEKAWFQISLDVVYFSSLLVLARPLLLEQSSLLGCDLRVSQNVWAVYQGPSTLVGLALPLLGLKHHLLLMTALCFSLSAAVFHSLEESLYTCVSQESLKGKLQADVWVFCFASLLFMSLPFKSQLPGFPELHPVLFSCLFLLRFYSSSAVWKR